uniref:ParB N-terminal domain-containing protein n=1 Tax=Paenibacillus rhizosphaerae TaxID=297318 RepID=UPI0016137D4F
MKNAYGDWDFPPLIVFYSAGKYEIADGRHRNEAFRQMKIKQVPVVFWTDSEEDFRYMIEHTSSMEMNFG